MSIITFSVDTADGENPPTKGSAQGFPIMRASGKWGVVITNDNPKNKAWATRVAWVAKASRTSDCPWTGPVKLSLLFRMRRPKSIQKDRELPITRPDLDKLIRSIVDSMTGVLYVDDAQIIALAASKEYGEEPGVYIELTGGSK